MWNKPERSVLQSRMADAAGFREALEEPIVKVSYDRGNLVAVEILDASQRVTDARRVDFQMTE